MQRLKRGANRERHHATALSQQAIEGVLGRIDLGGSLSLDCRKCRPIRCGGVRPVLAGKLRRECWSRCCNHTRRLGSFTLWKQPKPRQEKSQDADNTNDNRPIGKIGEGADDRQVSK